MQTQLEILFTDFAHRRAHILHDLQIQAPDVWHVRAAFTLAGQGEYCIRNLCDGDVPLLEALGRSLSDASRVFFSPYPWEDPVELRPALAEAVRHAVERVDAAYLLLHGEIPVGHFLLWKAGGNAFSQALGVQVPELGIALADAYHGHGLGSLAMRFLNLVARELHADAIELTTGLTNEAGWRTYLRAGYEFTGIISNPILVDVIGVLLGEVEPGLFEDERQMVCILRPEQREAILAYLACKREALAALAAAKSR